MGTSTGTNIERPDRNLAIEIVRVTEAAAMSAARWQGRGDKIAGDQAAVDAMRQVLDTVVMEGTIIIGEGEKDEAPMLFNGERVGTGQPPQVDLAVDPVDGTRLLAEGRPGAIAVLAAAPAGALFDPGPCVYMEKLVVGAEAAAAVDLDRPLADNLHAVARALGRDVSDITVMMLDRDRHEEAKAAIRKVGARLQLIPDGDVAAAILAAWEERPQVDVLYGIGGTPEGVTSACAVKALGGQILGRLWARNDAEAAAAREAGYELDRILTVDDLVTSEDSFFACTGITDSQLLRGVMFDGIGAVTQSLVMRSKSGTVRTIEARHRLKKLREYAAVAY
jgi:fructose-1,6-bisphosphatase II